jgi:hypothetical protein
VNLYSLTLLQGEGARAKREIKSVEFLFCIIRGKVRAGSGYH